MLVYQIAEADEYPISQNRAEGLTVFGRGLFRLRAVRLVCALWVLLSTFICSAKATCQWGTSYFVAEQLLFANTQDSRTTWFLQNCQVLTSSNTFVRANTITWNTASQNLYSTRNWLCSASGVTYSYTATTCVWNNLPPLDPGNATPIVTASPATINPGESTTLTVSFSTVPGTSGGVIGGQATGTWDDYPHIDQTRTVSPTATTTYTYHWTNPYGETTGSVTVTVNQPSPPTCSLTASPTTINRGSSSTLTASCTPAATSYTWTNSGFASSAASGSVSPTTTTTYSVVGRNGGGDGSPATATVTVNQPPTCTLSATPTTINRGGSTTLAVSCTPAATSYTWTNTGFASSATGGSVSPTTDATYSVVGHNAVGDSSSASVTVTVNQPPTCSLSATPSTINRGGSTTLTASCTPAAASYTWSSNAGLATSASSGSVSPTSDATYTVTGTNAAGDGAGASTTVTVNQPPTCTLSAAPSTINRGGSTTLTASCTPAATSYIWTNTGFASSAASGSVSPTSDASYSVIGHNAAGDGASASATVTVNQPPTCSLSASPTSINLGGSSTLTASCSPAATSYSWTNTGFASSASSGSVSPTTDATYSVVGHNAAGDSSSASATVTVNLPPTCTLNASPSTINRGDSSTLTATCSPAATSYSWTNSGFSSSASTGGVSPTSTTSYSVQGTNAAGTGATANATVTVNAPAVPVCTLTATPVTINLGETSALSVSCSPAATSYAWTGANFASSATGGNVSPTATATYSVIGHNAAGDGVSAPATVTVNALTEVTSGTQINGSALTLNRATGKYSGTITVTNTSGAALTGPVYVFFTLTAGVTFPTLPTSGGLPYITIPGTLAPGAVSGPVTLTFTNPTNARIGYTTKRYVSN